MSVIENKNVDNVDIKTIQCPHCKQDFIKAKSWNPISRFCSYKCSNEVDRPCGYVECKNTFKRKSGYNYFCSMECFTKSNPGDMVCPLFA